MKKVIGLLSLAGLVLAVGCTKLKNLTTINVDVPLSNSTSIPKVYDTSNHIPFPAAGVSASLPSISIPTNSQQFISGNNTTVNDITSVSMKSATIQMTAPSGANFDYLDSINVYLSATNLPTILFASKTSIPKGQNTINLDLSPADTSMKSYFLKDTLNISANAHFNNLPPANYSVIQTTITFHVTANPLN
jgi:hypothetical protein